MDYRKLWALLFVGLAIIFVPGFFWAAGSIVAEAMGPAYDTTAELVSGTVDVVTDDTDPGYTGPTHVVPVQVTFDVNHSYHGWGQLLASYHQLPEITGRVFAARIVDGHVVEELPDAGLLSQLRMNWHSTGRMRWTHVRVRVPEYHGPIGARTGWHLCVELHEASEGHNILGAIQDALHFVHADLSTGDVPAAAECVELDNNSYPYNYNRRELTRPGETRPTGTLSMIFEGVLTDHSPRGDFGGGTF